MTIGDRVEVHWELLGGVETMTGTITHRNKDMGAGFEECTLFVVATDDGSNVYAMPNMMRLIEEAPGRGLAIFGGQDD